jgi:RNA polymerase sigma-70 factor (ECF subfamily)
VNPVQAAEAEVGDLFRRHSGRIVATLTRALGAERIDLAHDAAQDAFVRALQSWPWHGVPENPSAWLIRAARNRAIDVIRRERWLAGGEDALAAAVVPSGQEPSVFDDDQLALIFLCCHPELAPEVRVALTLRSVCGFSTREIARAFLLEEATVAQRLVRAKRAIRERGLRFEMPPEPEMRERLGSVLAVIYLVFNEGYSATSGETLLREEMCEEAIWLATMLVEHPGTGSPAVHALLSLMLLQAARLPARVDSSGELLLFEEQDRGKWDARLVRLGFEHLDRAATGDEITPYHVQAAIAAAHAHPQPDWEHIVRLYDDLLVLQPSPVVELNRAVALSRSRGPGPALERVANLHGLERWHLYHAVTARLWRDAGDCERAAAAYRAALACSCTEPERRFLNRMLEQVL